MVDSPQKCRMDDDCGDAELLTCDLKLKVCKCREKSSVLSSTGSCIPARQLGEECVEDAQCRVIEKNTSCEENSCVCDSGFNLLHDNNGSLCNPAGDDSTVASIIDMKVIIILVALSIMFVGICGALHLFSKQDGKSQEKGLQVFAVEVERLMSLAYAECPLDVRESLAVQFFVDAIRDKDTQFFTRLMDLTDLKSAMTYSMKYEATKTTSKISRQARSIEIEDNIGEEKEDKFESLLKA
ncbi:hypothetical protein AVEN_184101-1 [Araneus ventricosus]|uniref:EB domain-containing protein n=1 Tax=Araneus ventricosus TaxID=182803 RepID=A0A4Y2CY50_ARAVE|nr:hypothetical protein AVEN_184101-1 [Araneus ventricosus]